MKTNKSTTSKQEEALALDLLDFCGGAEPSFYSTIEFLQKRDLPITPERINSLLRTAYELYM